MINEISLFSKLYPGIFNETSGDYDKKQLNTIFQNSSSTISDGVIGNFKQSSKTGDCYLLSSLYSLSTTTEGKVILKNNIKKESNGNFKITLPGAIIVKKDYEKDNKQCFITGIYTITKSEISRARKSGKYSQGDIDVLLYELAFEKYRKEVIKTNEANHQTSQYGIAGQYIGDGTMANSLNGGQGHDAMFILTGKKSKQYLVSAENVYAINPDSIKSISSVDSNLSRLGTSRLLDNMEKNPGRYSVTISFKLDNGNKNYGYHALSISKVENGRVYFVNPWDSTKQFSLTKEELLKCTYNISILDLGESSFLDSAVNMLYNGFGNFTTNLNNIYNYIAGKKVTQKDE